MPELEKNRHLVVYTATDMYSVRHGIARLLAMYPNIDVTVFQQRSRKSVRQLMRNQWRNILRHGWRWIPYQGLDALARLKRTPRLSYRAIVGNLADFEALARSPRFRWKTIPNLHASEVIDEVRELAPELGVSLAAPILKASLFSIPRQGTLNLHKGKVPDFKGMPPAFWELEKGASEVGCTVHWISDRLDEGDVVLTSKVPVPSFPSVRGMQLRLDTEGVELMARAVGSVLQGTATRMPQSSGGSTHRRPTLAHEAALNRRLEQRTPRASLPIRLAKRVYFEMQNRLVLPLWRVRRGLRPIVVLLYHRINDDLRDGVTNGVAQFDAHMAYLSKNTHVVSLESLLGEQERLDLPTDRPTVAVTFDDGYKDNYEFAAPILERHGVHATFFVSTGLMDTARGFEHDLQKLGKALPNMSWNHIRELHERGFAIGSHTINHARLSTCDPLTLANELRASKEHVEKVLGETCTLFAYPFGGKADITPEARRAVFDAGYQVCCSAYGGQNISIDRTDVKRVTISFAHDMAAFEAIVHGFTRERGSAEKASYET